MCKKHFDQAFILRTVLANRLELVATGAERGARGVFEGGDRRIGLDARVDQIFGQGADNAIAPRINLTDLVRMLSCSLQHATGRGVDHGSDPARLCVKGISWGHDKLPGGR